MPVHSSQVPLARQEMLSIKEGRVGTVSVGLGESFDGDIILDAVLQFRKAHPGRLVLMGL